VHEPLLVLDTGLRVQLANQAFYRLFDTGPEATLQQQLYELADGRWDSAELRKLLHTLVTGPGRSTMVLRRCIAWLNFNRRWY
jgi:two-component system CheB/CheR fusion protein